MKFRESGCGIGVFMQENHTLFEYLKKILLPRQSIFFFPSLNKRIGTGTSSFLTINLCFSKF